MDIRNLANQRIGLTGKNKFGSVMEIIEYKRAGDILVKFENGNPVHTTWSCFIKSSVRNVYDKSIYGIGYIGEGEYKTSENGKRSVQYKAWKDMLTRCYCDRYQKNNPWYNGCSVDERFHNFQNFASWYDENYYEISGEKMQLDKDILVKGNKIYSPEACVFVPQRINLLFTKSDSNRKLPMGVTFHKQNKSYISQCFTGIRMSSKSFKTQEEAFLEYKINKEKYIKEVAIAYKDKIPNKLYKAMLKYEVEITD